VGEPLQLEFSMDLVHWQKLLTNTAVAGGMEVASGRAIGTDPIFYRACEERRP
jgi:hypothetical protein